MRAARDGGAAHERYERIIRGLGAAPIILGHSFGGLLTQILLDRRLGPVSLAIHPAPPSRPTR